MFFSGGYANANHLPLYRQLGVGFVTGTNVLLERVQGDWRLVPALSTWPNHLLSPSCPSAVCRDSAKTNHHLGSWTPPIRSDASLLIASGSVSAPGRKTPSHRKLLIPDLLCGSWFIYVKQMSSPLILVGFSCSKLYRTSR